MFLSFIQAVSAHNFSNFITHLTDLPPNNGVPYMVMFHKPGCVHCTRLAPTWEKAAELGEGVATFAELDCSINETACKSLMIDSLPQIFHFLNGQVTPYRSMQISRLFVNFASSFLNDTWIPVDESNFSAPSKAAILFTEKKPIPKIWVAIQNAYNHSDVPFYVSDDKKLLQKLGLKTFPAAYFKDGDNYFEYPEKLVTHDVVKFINSKFDNVDKEL